MTENTSSMQPPAPFTNEEDRVRAINEFIRTGGEINKNKISDGYHTFGELYEHRIELFITLCRWLVKSDKHTNLVWRSKKNADGGEWDGWFLMGIDPTPGSQISYHLPISKWDECDFVDETREQAPPFDGHTSNDVLKRLKSL
jgi:hypothetical protein